MIVKERVSIPRSGEAKRRLGTVLGFWLTFPIILWDDATIPQIYTIGNERRTGQMAKFETRLVTRKYPRR